MFTFFLIRRKQKASAYERWGNRLWLEAFYWELASRSTILGNNQPRDFYLLCTFLSQKYHPKSIGCFVFSNETVSDRVSTPAKYLVGNHIHLQVKLSTDEDLQPRLAALLGQGWGLTSVVCSLPTKMQTDSTSHTGTVGWLCRLFGRYYSYLGTIPARHLVARVIGHLHLGYCQKHTEMDKKQIYSTLFTIYSLLLVPEHFPCTTQSEIAVAHWAWGSLKSAYGWRPDPGLNPPRRQPRQRVSCQPPFVCRRKLANGPGTFRIYVQIVYMVPLTVYY